MPLSGTMKPKPLATSNHLMTPAISMSSVAASSEICGAVAGRKLVPDIFDALRSDVMTPTRCRCPGASSRALQRISILDNAVPHAAKDKKGLAHSLCTAERGRESQEGREGVADVA